MRHVLPLLLVLVSLSPARARAAEPQLTASAAIVVDAWSGAVLYARHPDAERYPASTVKVMTALVALRSHVALKRVVTVSALAAGYGGSTAGLYAGERMTLWDLLHGMLLPSGNDAAIAVSQAVGGTTSRFVAMMNAEAIRLHLWHTHYLSPNGFDMNGQVTTPRDLAALARVAMEDPTFRKIVRARSWTVRSATGQIVHHWYNLNHLLWSSSSVDGVKTGTTPGAGACLVSSARRDGRWVIEVNMGSSESSRFPDGMALLNYGFQHASTLPST
jgi:D-alanyl-D-alanine carboxypeptidase (penicillin-binding protein 5/6)